MEKIPVTMLVLAVMIMVWFMYKLIVAKLGTLTAVAMELWDPRNSIFFSTMS